MFLTWTCLTILTAIDVSAYVSLRDEVKELREQIQSLKDKATDTYTRWGQTSCPTGATTVYVGFTAGARYSHTGGAANYVCLSKSPIFDFFQNPKYTAYIYGTEYQTRGTSLSGLNNHEAPCAVCQVPRTSVIMVPGRNDCPDNFKLEYAGYLMAGHYEHAAASEFICVDRHPTEDEYSSPSDLNGKLLYFVRASCGSLKCLPYRMGKVITCAVCSFSP